MCLSTSQQMDIELGAILLANMLQEMFEAASYNTLEAGDSDDLKNKKQPQAKTGIHLHQTVNDGSGKEQPREHRETVCSQGQSHSIWTEPFGNQSSFVFVLLYSFWARFQFFFCDDTIGSCFPAVVNPEVLIRIFSDHGFNGRCIILRIGLKIPDHISRRFQGNFG